MSFDNTQITSASGYNTSNIVYGKPRDGNIPGSSVTFKRIQMGTRNPDGTLGELILSTSRLFSFGLSPSVNMTTGKTDGYTLAMCLTNMDAPTQEEKAFLDTFNKICDHAVDYILQHRDDVGKYELEKADLKKFNPVYIKREKGKIVEGSSPMLYAKVLQNKKMQTITSLFYDKYGRDIDPMTLMNKQCFVKAAIKIEGIFIGSKVSLQVKLHEAEVEMRESGVKRLLRPSAADAPAPPVQSFASAAHSESKEEEDGDADVDDDKGSLKGDDDGDDTEAAPSPAERAPSPPPAPAKAPVRRIGKTGK
jgi:Protein of unknown function (DUF2738)